MRFPLPTRELHHEIDIDAPAGAVWAALTDTAAYGEWNPFVLSLSGELTEGARLTARIAPPGGSPMTFKPTVVVAGPERELRWRGRLLMPGVFDGEHSLRLVPLGDGRTRFIQAEQFRGVLVGLAGGTLDQTLAGFAAMNEALKLRVESSRNAARPHDRQRAPALV